MKAIHPSYGIIAGFFSAYSLSQAAAYLNSAIQAADSDKIWKGRSPADLLFFFEKFDELFTAVFIIYRKYKKKEARIKENNNTWSLACYDVYCGRHGGSDPWEFFPRHLNQKEFLNPYSAFKKVYCYRTIKEWKDCFKNLLEHALSLHSLHEFDENAEILAIYLLLHKFLEAAHLVEVRVFKKGTSS